MPDNEKAGEEAMRKDVTGWDLIGCVVLLAAWFGLMAWIGLAQ